MTNIIFFFSILVSSIIFILIRKSCFLENKSFRSDIFYFLLCSEFFKKDKKLPIKLPSYYILEYRNQYYPPGFSIFLSFFSQKFLKKYHHYINHLVELINILFISIACFLQFDFHFMFISFAIILYAFQTSLINELISLTSRSLALFFFNIILFFLFLVFEAQNFYYVLVSVFFTVLLIFTHKLTIQLLFLISVIFFLANFNLLFLLYLPISYLLAFMINSKQVFGIIKHHLEIVKFWSKNWSLAGEHPIYASNLFSKISNNIRFSYFNFFTAKNFFNKFKNLIAHNFIIVYVFFNFFYASEIPVEIYNLSLLIFTIYGFALLVHFMPFLRGIGLGVQYIKFTIFPSILYLILILQSLNQLDLIQIILIFFLIFFTLKSFYDFKVNLKKDSKINDSQNLRTFLNNLNKKSFNKKKKILCLPYSMADTVVYYLRAKVLWGTHGFGFRMIDKIFPVFRLNFSQLLDKFNISYLLFKKSYIKFKYQKSDVIYEDESFIFLKINKKNKSKTITFEKLKRKIFFIIGQFNIGGTEKQLHTLINNLDKKNFEVSLFLINKEGVLIKSLDKKVKVYGKFNPSISKLKLIPIFLDLLDKVKKTQPDIIHCFLPLAYILGGFVGLLINHKKLIMSRRSLATYFSRSPLPLLMIEKFLHKNTNLFLANSNAVANDLLKEGVSKQNIKIIYNGVLVDEEKAISNSSTKIEKQFGIHDQSFKFLVLANFIPYKNHKLVINAAKKLINENENFKVIFVGGGGKKDYLYDLKNMVRIFNLEEVVIFHNQINQHVYEYIKFADAGISSSTEEGFSNSILEFLYLGVPVIATNVGGNPELINNSNGIIVKNNDVNEMKEAMKSIMNNRQKYKKMCYQAKKTSRNFSIKKMVDGHTKIYDDI